MKRFLLISVILTLFSAPASAQDSCPGALPSRLIPGTTATVLFTDGSPLNVRQAPAAGAERVGQIPEGSAFDVLDGPVCADNIAWWHIRYAGDQTVEGWAAEGANGTYFISLAAPVSALLPADALLVYSAMDGPVTIDVNGHVSPITTPGDIIGVTYHAIAQWGADSSGASGITLSGADGSRVGFIPAPRHDGTLESVKVSADGRRAAWLYNLTPADQHFGEDCAPDNGCIGRVYDLVVTGEGSETLLWNATIDFPYPYIQLDGWLASDRVALRRVPWGVVSAYGAVQGGGILVIDWPSGTVTDLKDLAPGEDQVISADGHWEASSTGDRVEVQARSLEPGGPVFEVPFTDPFARNLTLSPQGSWLVWTEIEHSQGIDLAAVRLKVMSLRDGHVRTLAEFGPSVPPVVPVPGVWLTDNLLVTYYDEGGHLLDMVSGQDVLQAPLDQNVFLGTLHGMFVPE